MAAASGLCRPNLLALAIMEPLHAPWRIAYIRGPKPTPANAAIFKQIAESSDDVANYVVVRDRTCFACSIATPTPAVIC
jgi:hypothetical protein